jgi:diguanylate cyclase (GGDEF)-like protein/PAS domain S-box-containing protein
MIEKTNHALRTALSSIAFLFLPAHQPAALHRPPFALAAFILAINRKANNRSWEKWRHFFRAIPLGSALFDVKGRCIEILSDSLMPFEPGALLNSRLSPDAAERMDQALNVVLEGKASGPVEFSIENAWYEANLVPMEGHALGFFSDISQKKQAEYEKARFQSILRSIGNGVIATDEKGRVTYLNPLAEKMTGWPMDKAIGRPISEVFSTLVEASREISENPALEALRLNSVISPRKSLLLVSRNGSEIGIDETAAPILVEDGRIAGTVTAFHDISASQHLLWHAGHDALTGLINRVLLHDRLIHSMASVKRQGNLLAVMFIDLDGFKGVNDQLGHAAGDMMLKEVAQRLKNAVRAEDTVARLGGDEFIVLQEASDKMEVMHCLERIMGTIKMPFKIEDMPMSVSTSIGIALYPENDSEPETLLRQADMAMYHAKQSGRDQYRFFDSNLDAMARKNNERQNQIASALKNGEFRLFYQPKIDLRNGRIMGLEALIRWMDPDLGMPVLPPDFLPAIQDTHLIVEIGSWVINHVLDQMSEWQKDNISIDVSINIAGRQLHDPDFVDMLKAAFDAHPDIEPSKIELEILEEAAIEDFNFTLKVISACRQIGVRFSIDDFGTGHSSLSYLKNLPVDRLKIDRTFISNMMGNKDNLAVIQSIVSLSRIFNREVIAEGLESIEQGRMLIEMGCSLGQGYCIAKPMPGEAFLNWMERWNRNPQWLH